LYVWITDNLNFTLKITLCKVQPRVISFEEQVASIRQHLADIYEREQSWREAANVLVGIPLETGQK
jgi:COP9 signalosome complex subunit 4